MNTQALPDRPLRLHRHALSGHSHRAELFLSILGLPFELVDVDLAARAQKSPEFLAKNRFGQVPVLEDGEVVVADSTAILVYLATRYDEGGSWLPRDAKSHAEVVRWFAVAAVLMHDAVPLRWSSPEPAPQLTRTGTW